VTPAPSCIDYRKLKDLHDAARRVYIEGAKVLEGAPQGQEFESAYQTAENAMVAFVSAREKLEKHIADHGCVELLEPNNLYFPLV